MFQVRRLAPEESGNLPLLSDAVLVSEIAVTRIGGAGFSLSFAPLKESRFVSCPPPPPNLAEDTLAGRAAVFGAFAQDKLAGWVVLRSSANGWADIEDLRVDTAYRRKGAGRALIDTCCRFASRYVFPGLRIATDDGNPGLCQFLLHTGFTLQGVDRMLSSGVPANAGMPFPQRPCALFFYRTFSGR